MRLDQYEMIAGIREFVAGEACDNDYLVEEIAGKLYRIEYIGEKSAIAFVHQSLAVWDDDRDQCSIQTEIRVVDCMDYASVRQNFDSDAVALSRNFNDTMVRNRQFTILIFDRME